MRAAILLLLLLVPAGMLLYAETTAPEAVLERRLPSVRGTSLAGDDVRLPEDLSGDPAILLVAYRRGTQSDIDRWMAFLDRSRPDLKRLEVPAIASPLWRPLQGWIDGGMRRGVPKEKWGAVVTLYEDAPILRDFLGDPGGYGALVVLLDGEGTVRWFHTGGFSDQSAESLGTALDAIYDGPSPHGDRQP